MDVVDTTHAWHVRQGCHMETRANLAAKHIECPALRGVEEALFKDKAW